jgi:hypothetical protein
MTIDVKWFDEAQHILLWDITESWTVDDFYEAFEETQQRTRPLNGQASVIVDARRVTGRPRDNLITHFRHALTHANLRQVVYLRDRSGGLFIQMLVNAVFRIYPNIGVDQFQFARTLDEAVDLIVTEETDDTTEA